MPMRLVRDDEGNMPLQIPKEVRERYEKAKLKFGGENNAAHRPNEEAQKVIDKISEAFREHGIEPVPELEELFLDLFRHP